MILIDLAKYLMTKTSRGLLATAVFLVLPLDAMHSADYAVARCPSVRLSHAGMCQNG